MGILSGVTGAIGGLFSTGSPLGAAAGLAGGLFGGNDTTDQSMSYMPLSSNQEAMVGGINKSLPGLMEALNPTARNEMSSMLGKRYSKILGDKARRAFEKQGGRMRGQFARSGGGPSSVINSQSAELAAEEGRAIGQANLQGEMMGEEVAGNRFRMDLSGAASLGGLLNSTYQGQRVAGQVTTDPNSNFSGALRGVGEAMTSPGSYFSQNSEKFGRFSAPIFGRKKQPPKLNAGQANAVGNMLQQPPITPF